MTHTSLILPPLYAILNVDSQAQPLEFAKQLLIAGIGILQIRSKTSTESRLEELSRKVIEHRDALAPACKIIINDNPELCEEVGADGVHLGQEDKAVTIARDILGTDALIGLSTHNIEQMKAAQAEPIDYVALGPIFGSQTKQGHADIVGLDTLSQAASISSLPIVAIGGITSESAPSVFRAGARSVAIIRDLEVANDLGVLHRAYQSAAS